MKPIVKVDSVSKRYRIGASAAAYQTLRDTLTAIRESGYCISREEMTDGASSVAAPVRGPNGDVVAAISVVVPADRPDLTSLVPAVRVAAAGISRGLRPRRRPT